MITVDARCDCKACRDRTENIYRMIGNCYNCHTKDILILYRAGDKSSNQDCPVCGNYKTVHTTRLATDDEFPELII